MRVALRFLLAAVVLCPLTAVATIINIPGDYPTIQEGIDHSSEGDTVLVQPGTYYEHLRFGGVNLVLGSLFLTTGDTTYISRTIIDAYSSWSVISFISFSSGQDSTTQVVGFTIQNGDADLGGGIFCLRCTPTIRSNTITGNSARLGGGIWCDSSSAKVVGNTISGNTAAQDGGGIYSFKYSHMDIRDNIITGNSASGEGGGIACHICTPSVSSNTITRNYAELQGGGISAGSDPVITDNQITENSTDGWGGGIYYGSNWGPNPATIMQNIITDNRAARGGGLACFRYSGTCPLVIANLITGNTAAEGGGIAVYGSRPTIRENTITANGSTSTGGGIWCDSAFVELIGNTISSNSAISGGGVYCFHSGDPVLSENLITGNSASTEGGGIHCAGCDATVSGNVLTDNRARSGGAVCCVWCKPTISQNTISQNSAEESGGALYCSYRNPALNNSILWGDTAPNGPEIFNYQSSPRVSYCDVQGGCPGQGNIDCDPLFRDPGNGDFQITWESYPIPDSTKSCCIDAGDPGSPPDPDSTIADIGALYFDQYLWVGMVCENLTPVFCRGKDFYFKLTVDNQTRGYVSGVMTFSGYAGYYCDPGNVLIDLVRSKTYPPGITETYYYFQVPNAALPGQYSTSISGTLAGWDLFCCMNVDIIQCSPFKVGDNTEWQLVEVNRPELSLPTVTELHQNYPNPFNATTLINYQLAAEGYVTLEVYNLIGEKLVTLVDEIQEAGYRSVTWDASKVSSGLYFCKLTAGDFTETRSMMLVK